MENKEIIQISKRSRFMNDWDHLASQREMAEGSEITLKECVRCHMFGSRECLDGDSICGSCKKVCELKIILDKQSSQIRNLESRIRILEGRQTVEFVTAGGGFQRSVALEDEELRRIRHRINGLLVHAAYRATILSMLYPGISPLKLHGLHFHSMKKLPSDLRADIFECNVSIFLADLSKFCSHLQDTSTGLVYDLMVKRLFNIKQRLEESFHDFRSRASVRRLRRPVQNTEPPQCDEEDELGSD